MRPVNYSISSSAAGLIRLGVGMVISSEGYDEAIPGSDVCRILRPLADAGLSGLFILRTTVLLPVVFFMPNVH